MATSLPLPLAPVVPPGPEAAQPEGHLDALWGRVLEALANDATITRASFSTWLKGTRLAGRDGSRFTVAAQHGFARDKLDRSFREAIERALRQETGVASADVEFVVPGFSRPAYTRLGPMQPLTPAPVQSEERGMRPSAAAPAKEVAPAAGVWPGSAGVSPALAGGRAGTPALPGGTPQHVAVQAAPVASPRAPAPLNPRYTFASFVSGRETQLAAAAARAVAENPVLAYNPLFLHGAAGTGKTHLLHAIGNALAALRPSWRIVSLSCRRLLDDLEQASSRGERAAVLAAYATGDVLLLDDVQELEGQPAQKEALHLLDSFIAAGKQVVAAADRSPRAMPGLDERLRSCLQMGLVADLAPPELETRLAILRTKLEARGVRSVSLPPGTLEQIAGGVTGSVRDLEGALTRVLAAAELSRAPITPDGVTAALSGTVGPPGGRPSGTRVRLSPQHVLQGVSAAFCLPVAVLVSRRRDKEVVLPRQVAMYLMRQDTDASLSEIGAALGGRDHTTVMHGCEKIASAARTDERLRAHLEAARRHILTHAAAAAARLDSA